MPWFRRADGDVVSGVGPVRRMMPHIMRTRAESFVMYEQVLDLTETLPFIERFNATHRQQITLFHVVFYAVARSLLARPGLNRFVTGGRLYQRRELSVSFSLKREHHDESPLLTAKLNVAPDEAFETTVAHIHDAVRSSRVERNRSIDKELRLLSCLPHWALRLAVACVGKLDAHNLLPAAFIRNDPLYSTIMIANLGSIGIDRVWHHLYEYGTIGFFCTIGQACKTVVPGPGDQPVVRTCLRLRFNFDERINDGFYCIAGLEVIKRLVEHPESLLESVDKPRACHLVAE